MALAFLLLCWAVATEQGRAKLPVAVQKAAQDEASDLLMLGLYDPAVVGCVAWFGFDRPALLAFMKDDRLSIFGTADFAGVSRHVADRGKSCRRIPTAARSCVRPPTRRSTPTACGSAGRPGRAGRVVASSVACS